MKSLPLTLTIVLCCAASSFGQTAYRADANGDGRVNIGDALVIARSAGGLVKPPVTASVGDVNLSDSVNIGDALVVALFAGGIKTNFDTPAITSAAVGESVTLTGTGFSSTAENNVVIFSKSGGGFVSATPASVSVGSGSKTLTVTVPTGAVSGPVFVKRKDLGLPGQPFVLTLTGSTPPLYISKVAPFTGIIAGTTSIALSGSGFDSTAANNTITFSASGETTVTATPSAASTTSLTVVVPSAAVSGFVSIGVGNQTSNRKSILVAGTTTPLRVNQIYYPDAAGEPILIEGTGFNPATISDNQVLFGGASAVVVIAGRTELIVLVPTGAASGTLKVTTNGGANVSNNIDYGAVSSSTSSPPPTINSITPSSGTQGSTLSANIGGADLTGATAVVFNGTGVTAAIASGGTSTSLPMTITVAPGTALGLRTFTVATGAGTSAVFSGFTVNSASAAILFVDSSDAPVKELIVNEGNAIQARVRILDSSGAPRTGVSIAYTSLNPDVASVDSSGNIQGKKAGFSTLTAAGGGLVAAATITVVQVSSGSTALDVTGVAQDSTRIYLAASADHTIRTVTAVTQSPALYAGTFQSPGLKNDLRLESLFKNPAFIAVDPADGTLYVTDSGNNIIRRVQPGADGRVETLAGTGSAGNLDGSIATATFNNPQGIALDSSRNLWIADTGNHTIRKINLVAGTVETIAGLAGTPGSSDGSGNQARFRSPVGIAIETETVAQKLDLFRQGGPPAAARIIVADTGNGLIRRVTAAGAVETVLGSVSSSATTLDTKGPAKVAAAGVPLRFDAPTGVAVDQLGNIYVTEPNTGLLKTILRIGTVVSATQSNSLKQPKGVAVTPFGKIVVADKDHAAAEINYGKPEIISVTPEPTSGARVTIKGRNFAPETAVIASGVFVTDLEVRDTETIVVTVPPLPGGVAASLTVLNRGGLQGILTSDLALRAADTPHALTGNLLVSAGVKLELEPGVTLKAEPKAVIAVNGRFIARGTANAPIRLTSNNPTPQPGDWGYLLFTNTSVDAQYDSNGAYVSGSILENVIIEYAGASITSGWTAGLALIDAAPFINRATIRQNRGWGIYANLAPAGNTLRITNSSITNNDTGLYAAYPGTMLILDNNTIASNAGAGAVLKDDAPTGYGQPPTSTKGVASVTNNEISNNTGHGLSTLNSRDLKISNNKITGNQGGLSLGDSSNGLRETIDVKDNVIRSNRSIGIELSGLLQDRAASAHVLISGNTIQDNAGGGIYASFASEYLTISGNTIRDNRIRGGIAIVAGHVEITGNIIVNNSAAGSGAGAAIGNTSFGFTFENNIVSNNVAGVSAGGVYLKSVYGDGTIKKNLISGNVAPKDSAFTFNQGSPEFPISWDISSNTITQNRSTAPDSAAISIVFQAGSAPLAQNNVFNNAAPYALQYRSPSTHPVLNVQNNWWGTTNDAAIQTLIYDFNDDGISGVVSYTPILTTANTAAPISPPAGLRVIAATNALQLSWSGNPESDVTGYKVHYGTTSGPPYTVVNAGNVTTHTLGSLAPGTTYISVTAYDTGGSESWYAIEEAAIVGGGSITSSSTLTVTKSGTGTGIVASNPAGIVCGTDCSHAFANGTVVTLSAMTSANSVFSGWSGAGCSGTGSCIVTLTSDQSVTATFTALSSTGAGGVLSTTTWRRADSPIRVISNLLIPAGATLTIEPGVEVQFNAGKNLQVSGGLIARGTADAPIVFTSSQMPRSPGQWQSITFTDSAIDAEYDSNKVYVSGSILEYVVIEYGGGLVLGDATPLINRTTIQHNKGGIHVSVTIPKINYLRITNNVITGNDYGITANYCCTQWVADGNKITNNRGVGLLTGGHASPVAYGLATITNNEVSNNEGDGMLISHGGQGATISKNTIIGNRGSGIVMPNYSATVTVTDNRIERNAQGIALSGEGNTYTITGNTINANTGHGIASEPSQYPSGGSAFTISKNFITNNSDGAPGGGLYFRACPNWAPQDCGSRGEILTITSNVISNNTSGTSGGGMYVSGFAGSSAITNNLISGNVAPTDSGFAAIHLGPNAAVTVDISANTVTQNRATALDGAVVGIQFGAASINLNQNNLFNNSATYLLDHRTLIHRPVLNAQNNWWGSTTDGAISAIISDFKQDGSRSAVSFAPFLSAANTSAPVSPPAGLRVTAGTNSLQLNWSSNPESDLAGYKIYYGGTSIDAGNAASRTLSSLTPGTYAVTITAYDTSGNESWYSVEEPAIAGGGSTTPSATLTLTRAGTGFGTVISGPAGIACGTDCTHAFASGTVVTLSAATSASSAFGGWSGAGCSGTGSCTVTMNADQQVTATFSSTAPAPTGVYGQLSTATWRAADSPIQVTNNIFVPSGATLTIEPGVEVQVSSGKVLQIGGTLAARGTTNAPIRFTSKETPRAAGQWGFIVFTDSSVDAQFDVNGAYVSGSILENAVVEYAGASTGAGWNAGVALLDSAPFITLTTIRQNRGSGIYAPLNAAGLAPRITNNTITNNDSGFVSNYSNNVLLLEGNTIAINAGTGVNLRAASSSLATLKNNTISNNGDRGVYGANVAGELRITGNTISNNTTGGPGAGLNAGPALLSLTNNLITSNTSTASAGGVYLDTLAGTGSIVSNVIAANVAPQDGAMFAKFTGSYSVSTNTITENKSTATNAAAMTITFISGALTISQNNLHNNTAAYTLAYASPNTAPALNAQSDWWGTSSDSGVQALIYDFRKDGSRGVVTYVPFLTALNSNAPPYPPVVATQLTKTGGDNQSGRAGQSLTTALKVKVADSAGNPISGVTVTFIVVSGGGSISPSTAVSNGSGEAQSSATLGGQLGTQTFRAVVAGLTPVDFSATASSGPIAKLAISANPGQIIATRTSTLTITGQDQFGNTATDAVNTTTLTASPPATVTFTPASVQLSQGVATATFSATGATTYTITASSSGLPDKTTAITVTAPVPATLEIVDGNNQTGSAGQALSKSLKVRVKDNLDQLVAGVTVTFAVVTGGGTVSTGATSGSTVTATTNSSGEAQATATLGPAAAQQFSATVSGISPVTFNASLATLTGELIVVTNLSSGSISIIDSTNQAVVATVPVGTRPYGVAITPDSKRAYITHDELGEITVVNIDRSSSAFATVIARVNSEVSESIVITPDGKRAYSPTKFTGGVQIVDVNPSSSTYNTIIGKINGLAAPVSRIAMTPDGAKAYITHYTFNSIDRVSFINTDSTSSAFNTLTGTVTVGHAPIGIAITPDGKRAYVANSQSHTVSVIDAQTNTVTATIASINDPFAVTAKPDGKRVFVSNYYGGTVTVIDSDSTSPSFNTVIATPAAVTRGSSMAVTPDAGSLYVVSDGANSATVLNLSTNAVVKTIAVEGFPVGIATTNFTALSNPSLAWVRQFGSSSDDGANAVAINGGRVAVSGGTSASFARQTYAGGPADAFVRVSDTSGNEIWTRLAGTSGDERAIAVAVDGSGNIYVGGNTDSSLGGSSSGLTDAWLRKYDANGNIAWTRQFGTSGHEHLNGIVVDASGNVYVTGATNGEASGDETSNNGVVDTLGNVYVAGIIYSGGAFSGQTSAGAHDAFVAKMSLNGTAALTTDGGTGK